jgi:gas vesicle protein
MERQPPTTKTGGFVIGATLGAIAGIALGSLLIPKKTKDEIKEKITTGIKNKINRAVTSISSDIIDIPPKAIPLVSKAKKRFFKGIKKD